MRSPNRGYVLRPDFSASNLKPAGEVFGLSVTYPSGAVFLPQIFCQIVDSRKRSRAIQRSGENPQHVQPLKGAA